MKFAKILRAACLCLFLTFCSYSAHSQNLLFSSDEGLQLSEGYLIGQELSFSLTTLSDADKAVLFRDYNTELCSLRVDDEKQSLILELELRAQPRWNSEQWNSFLTRCKSH